MKSSTEQLFNYSFFFFFFFNLVSIFISIARSSEEPYRSNIFQRRCQWRNDPSFKHSFKQRDYRMIYRVTCDRAHGPSIIRIIAVNYHAGSHSFRVFLERDLYLHRVFPILLATRHSNWKILLISRSVLSFPSTDSSKTDKDFARRSSLTHRANESFL